jgi:type IV pilus modification protein PilV
MQTGAPKRTLAREAGFSMIEMLMTTFILAVGILGLTMLQTMSLRAAGGSRNLSMAVQLAEQMMDQIELEGRLTYSNATIGSAFLTPQALKGLQYIGQAAVNKYFSIDSATGNVVEVAEDASPLFQLSMTQTVAAGKGLSDVTVSVVFVDGTNNVTNAPITRTATLTRRILHA